MKNPSPANHVRLHVAGLLREAGQKMASGCPQDAEQVLQEALKVSPGDAQVLAALGIIAGKTGRLEEAVNYLRQALEATPKNPSTLCWMSLFLAESNQVDEATRYARLAVSAGPQSADTYTTLARRLVAQGKYSDAVPNFQTASELDPNNAAILVEYADALAALQLWLESKEVLKRAVLLAPSPKDLLRLAYIEFQVGDIEDASKYCRRALGQAPDVPSAHMLMARIHMEKLQNDEADDHWQRARELQSRPGLVSYERALSLSATGRFDEAIEELKVAIEHEPELGDAYRALVFARRISHEDLPLVTRMERLASLDTVPDNQRVSILYSLSKAYDNLGDFDKAIHFADEANLLNTRLKGSQPFNKAAFTAFINARIEIFTERLFRNWKHASSESSLPILIVGMMRSGTTLAEQMLSCHPMVGGAGEQDYWGRHEGSTFDVPNRFVDPSRLRTCSREYLSLLISIAPGFPHVIDKNPANLLALGAFHLAFPNARIIHTRRNAIDTALSIWMTPITTTSEFVGDRESIVHAYKECMRLLDHWQKVLPKDRFMEVRYEDLVAAPEVHVQRMVEFCGLEWDDACLHPELNQRRVRTPSMWQVRQPVYKTSTERWKNYEPWLGAFGELQGF